jgi:hypothetical protein
MIRRVVSGEAAFIKMKAGPAFFTRVLLENEIQFSEDGF